MENARAVLQGFTVYNDGSYRYVFAVDLENGNLHEHAHNTEGRLEICTHYNEYKKLCNEVAFYGFTLIHNSTPLEQH